MAALYSTLRWRIARRRALERDGNRCTVARLLGGRCDRGPLHVHHIDPVEDGGDAYELDNLGTTCARHHPMWEKLRRVLVRQARDPVSELEAKIRCNHNHPTEIGRRMCESRRARKMLAA